MNKLGKIIFGASLMVNGVLAIYIIQPQCVTNSFKYVNGLKELAALTDRSETFYIKRAEKSLEAESDLNERSLVEMEDFAVFYNELTKNRKKSRNSFREKPKAINKKNMVVKPLMSKQVSLYPSTTRSEINLDLDGYGNQDFGVFIISDAGKVEAYYEFRAKDASNRKMSLDVSSYDKGIYFAHLVSKGSRIIKKFVKV